MNRLSFLLRNLFVFTFCFSIFEYAGASTSIHSGYFESPLEGQLGSDFI